jgi:hypothetical protein
MASKIEIQSQEEHNLIRLFLSSGEVQFFQTRHERKGFIRKTQSMQIVNNRIFLRT